MKKNIYKIVDDRLGNDTSPYSYDVLMQWIEESNSENTDDTPFDAVVRNDGAIYDNNAKCVLAVVWDENEDGSAVLNTDSITGASRA